MKKFLLLFLITFFLQSCVSTFKDLESGLDKHNGLSLNTLIDRIGYPSAQMNIAGRKLYIWESSQTVS